MHAQISTDVENVQRVERNAGTALSTDERYQRCLRIDCSWRTCIDGTTRYYTENREREEGKEKEAGCTRRLRK